MNLCSYKFHTRAVTFLKLRPKPQPLFLACVHLAHICIVKLHRQPLSPFILIILCRMLCWRQKPLATSESGFVLSTRLYFCGYVDGKKKLVVLRVCCVDQKRTHSRGPCWTFFKPPWEVALEARRVRPNVCVKRPEAASGVVGKECQILAFTWVETIFMTWFQLEYSSHTLCAVC